MIKKNSGYTLVEIIVVIVILGIMVSVSIIGLSYFNNMNIETGMDNIVVAIDTGRIEQMTSKSTVSFGIVKRSSSYYCEVRDSSGSVVKEYKLFSSKFDLYINSIKINNSVNIRFNKSDGSIRTVECDGTEVDISSGCTINSPSADKYVILIIQSGRALVK